MSWLGSSFAINIAVGSMSLGVGRLGGPSVGRSFFFFNGSMYCHTLLVLAVSWMIKNHYIQSKGWLRIRLTFDSLVVVIFRIYRVRQGPIGGLAKTLF